MYDVIPFTLIYLHFFKIIQSVSGLAVKFDVAIVEPPVRLRANAYFFNLIN